VARNQNSAEAYYNLGYPLVMMGQQKHAAIHFTEALRIKPHSAQAREQLRAIDVPAPQY